ncbi:DUF4397 domain-containing protein [Peribacillus glennii]|uniref:DUF4397 domain-containing protein n=1 Tax=Peribacillus glennii TaxID=2303991 RepID=A0A372LGL3_9BACI|nr:DUF4397 domain-containing protein [Peribacillus glennii]RFU65448.1 DUF4397 domain-containing protein [Peribacillus glennii]
MPQSEGKFFQEATVYDLLAKYYKYSRPDLHVHYYHNHLISLQNAIFHSKAGFMQPQKRFSKVRVLQGSPDSTAIDICFNHNPVYKNVPYQTNSKYIFLPEGSLLLDILQSNEKGPSAFSSRVQLMAGNHYTLVVAGPPENLLLEAIHDEPFVPFGETKIRFAHFSPDAPDLDIAVKNGDIVFKGLTYRNATDYLGLTPMAVDLEVRAAGTREVILPLEGIRFEKDAAYTIYLLGRTEKAPVLTAHMLSP